MSSSAILDAPAPDAGPRAALTGAPARPEARRSSAPLPRLSGRVEIRAVGEGEFVVKDRRKRAYFRVGAAERFLLARLDGKTTSSRAREEFTAEFGEPLTREELKEFVAMIGSKGLLESSDAAAPAANDADPDDELDRQSWLFFRKPLIDPDNLLTALEPWLRFVWTRTFFALSLLLIAAGGFTLWTHAGELARSLPGAMRWETVVIVWATLVCVTTIHEFAHGLTCKHYGGHVHEMGVLMIFGMPCFYCDVSDAWMIPQKSRRLWVTAAGSYADLCVWAVSVFLWRAAAPDSGLHAVAQVILTTCGTRVFVNLNPLLRLDGYYLASDWLEVPNLRVRAQEYFMAHVRWLCWGAARPQPVERGGWILAYGLIIWAIAVVSLDLITLGMYRFVLGQFGWTGALLGALAFMFVSQRVFKGLLTSEFANMIKYRRLRTAVWAAAVFGIPALVGSIPMKHNATGDVLVRSGRRVEVHGAVAGFLQEIRVDEGAVVKAGDLLARTEVPDLASSIVRKEADLVECRAALKKLRAGPRPEQIAEQKARIRRLEDWVDLARDDLKQARISHAHGLRQLEQAVQQSKTELAFATQSLDRATALYRQRAYAGEQLRAETKRVALLKSRVAQAEAERLARKAEGVRTAEAELARREKELADARSDLALLVAGTRPEDIAAETARLARLEEELRFLIDEREKQKIVAPADGVVSTPRLNERRGALLQRGDLFCVIEDTKTLAVEIEVDEDSISGVAPGQEVQIRVRALPFDTFTARVQRIAPNASQQPGQHRSRVTVHCQVDNPEGKLKAGMTGSARIQRGVKRIATILWQRVLKELRTEFWW